MFVSLGPELQVVGCLKGEERVRGRTNIQGSQPTTAPMDLTHPRSAWIHLGGNNTRASIGPGRFSFVSARIHQFLTSTLSLPP